MTDAFWGALVVGTYFVGFIIAGAVEQRLCHRPDHHRCRHPFESPAPMFWPMVLPVLVVIVPFWGSAHISRWLAGRETLTERRDRLDVERGARVREQAATIARLEREAGLR